MQGANSIGILCIFFEFIQQTNLKDVCPVDALHACVFIYLPYILKNNVEFWRK